MTGMAQNSRERQYAEYHQDGLLDICIGLTTLLAGLFMLADMIYLVGIVPAVYLPIWQSGRKITLRRMGVDEIPGSQKRNTRMMVLLGLVVGLLAFFMVLGLYIFLAFDRLDAKWVRWIGEYFWLVVGVQIAGVMVLVAWMSGIRRLYGYAALFLLALTVGGVVGATPLAMIAFGTIALFCGLFLLVRFLRRYPAP